MQVTMSSPTACPTLTRKPRWKYEEADWVVFEVAFLGKMKEYDPGALVDFSSVISSAAETAIPKTSGKPERKALCWWRKEVKNVRKRNTGHSAEEEEEQTPQIHRSIQDRSGALEQH